MARPRARVVLLISIVVFGMLSAPALAKPPEGKGPVAACANGGYLSYTDSAGNAFTSVSECARYVQGGGVLVRLPSLTVSWTDVIDGTFYVDVQGSGLKPNANLYVETNLGSKIDVYRVDDFGNLSFHGGFYPCGTFEWFEYSTLDWFGNPIATRSEPPC